MGRHLAGHRDHVEALFIGSFDDGPGRASIVLRGDIDSDALERLGLHVEALLRTGVRFLTIEAAAVTSWDPALADLVGRTQDRLGSRSGMVGVRGLCPTAAP